MSIVFIDLEVNQSDKVVDIGAFINPNAVFHGDRTGLVKFISGYDYVCGHNIFCHDLKYLEKELKEALIGGFIDTLPLSALLFAERPYHRLVKNYKLDKSEKNDPTIDAGLAHDLFVDLVDRYRSLDREMQKIYFSLLSDRESFSGFFTYLHTGFEFVDAEPLIRSRFTGKFCENVDLTRIIREKPEELAYCLAIINTSDPSSISPEWILHQYGEFLPLMNRLRGTPCHQCSYCTSHFDAKLALKRYFGFSEYRLFSNQPLQEKCVVDQVNGKSIIVVFPTAGGKSIAFQVPAFIMADAVKGLTVVISPLQSLMQDQVKNLEETSVFNVGTINGAMNALERTKTIERVKDGDVNLLYLAPESLRSPSIFKLLVKRNIVRFVIDEAHCFSTWGHDFRVDYLYIAKFISRIQKMTMNQKRIPVSCYTATAKKEVLDDISSYFKKNLDLDMELITTDARRENLHFFVHDCKGHHEKMAFIKNLLEMSGDKPVIIYTSRRKSAELVSEELNKSGFVATYYHGGMKSELKNTHQLEFTKGSRNIIVATSAFGMGVDKKDVAYVIHYQVSATIEDYIQEAGRGGRDPGIQAECHILYDEKDVDEHFNLMTQSKLSQSEINQVWRVIKFAGKRRERISISSRELAKQAGWDLEQVGDFDTKIKTIITALENVGYIEREENSARIFATSIRQKSMLEVSKQIERLPNVDEERRELLRRIMKTLFTEKTTSPARGDKPVAMIDELYDLLGIEKKILIDALNILREHRILECENDLFAQIPVGFEEKKSMTYAKRYIDTMRHLIDVLDEKRTNYNLKELNQLVEEKTEKSDVKTIETALRYLNLVKIIEQKTDGQYLYNRSLVMKMKKEDAIDRIDRLAELSTFIIEYTYMLFGEDANVENKTVNYSVVSLKEQFLNANSTILERSASIEDIEKALLFIIRTGALIVDGGFLVLYNPMTIHILEKNTQKQYTQTDYETFKTYYNQKIQKIHILIHFIRNLTESEEKGLHLVSDYFALPYAEFEKKYITKEYRQILEKPMTKTTYDGLFKDLSVRQKEIISDKTEKNIVVLAGPGSGKTTLLVRKLASLVRLEDVKLSELMMLTFSRAATVIFKQKLQDLIGTRANYIAIKTFHAFCFDVLGEVGNLEKGDSLFTEAIDRIKNHEVEESLITKTTLVIDEAQDMSETEYRLIETLIEYNESMRIIAVGDDDQNIYAFRGSDSSFMMKLAEKECATYDLLTNFRSKRNLVAFTQRFVRKIRNRYKKSDCLSHTQEDGSIKLIRYTSPDFYAPIVEQVSANQSGETIAVLTSTNEEAEIMTGQLQNAGIHARLIQSNSSFRLANLFEVDSFLAFFNECDGDISKDKWGNALDTFKKTYESTPLFENLMELIHGFEILYPEKKYVVDLRSYALESKLEDLYQIQSNSVTVANIHKSKGREFDTVYIMHQGRNMDQEYLRALYVGLTRAKTHLIIHTDSHLFDDCAYGNIQFSEDLTVYEKPTELIVQFDHSEINLGGSKYCTYAMNRITTGTELVVDEKGCVFDGKYAVYFSKKAKESIQLRHESGYSCSKAFVQYKVRWYSEEENKTYWIALPKLIFTKYSEPILLQGEIKIPPATEIDPPK